MQHQFSLVALPVTAFAQAHAALQGTVPLARLERLLQEDRAASADTPVHYTLEGAMQTDAAGAAEPWLHLRAHTRITLTCQRCLEDALLEVEFDRRFRFVATEALAEIEDEESEEDVLVQSGAFDALELLEDELLMALPLVPRHTVCPVPVRLHTQDEDFDAPPEKPHPFAVLEKLKKDAG